MQLRKGASAGKLVTASTLLGKSHLLEGLRVLDGPLHWDMRDTVREPTQYFAVVRALQPLTKLPTTMPKSGVRWHEPRYE